MPCCPLLAFNSCETDITVQDSQRSKARLTGIGHFMKHILTNKAKLEAIAKTLLPFLMYASIRPLGLGSYLMESSNNALSRGTHGVNFPRRKAHYEGGSWRSNCAHLFRKGGYFQQVALILLVIFVSLKYD